MSALSTFSIADLSQPERVELAMAAGLTLPQQSAPVFHRFGPKIYIRECHMSAGDLIVGHAHRAPHTNVMLTGRIVLIEDGAETRELVAPWTFVSAAGRKVARIVEDTIWQNIIATDVTDVDDLEVLMFDKGAAFDAHEARCFAADVAAREPDRVDFASVADLGPFTSWLPLPDGCKVTPRRSPIDGRGLFASAPIIVGEVIAPAVVDGFPTAALRFVNHAREPNAVLSRLPLGDVSLVAARPISGCVGGGKGDEVVIDYRAAAKVLGGRSS